MRNWIYWLFVICLVSPVHSYAWMSPVLIGGGVETGGCMDGTYILAWDGDHPDGTNILCHTSGAGTLTGTNTNLTVSTSYGENSTYGSFHDSADERITWTQTAGQYIDGGTAQTLWFRAYLEGSQDIDIWFFETGDADDNITFKNADLNDYVVAYYKSSDVGGVNSFSTSASSPSTATWINVGMSWNPSNEDLAVYTNLGGWFGGRDGADISVPHADDPTSFSLGNEFISHGTGPASNAVYVDKWMLVSGQMAPAPPWMVPDVSNLVFYSGFEDFDERGLIWYGPGVTQNHSSSGLSMSGSYVVRADAGGVYMQLDFGPPGNDSYYTIFQWRYEDAFEADENIFYLKDLDNTTICTYEREASHSGIDVEGEGTTGATSWTLSPDTTYWFKIWYDYGTGSNSKCCISYWGGSSWDGETCDGGGTSTIINGIGQVRWANNQNSVGTEYHYWDEIYMFNGDYTGNPNSL